MIEYFLENINSWLNLYIRKSIPFMYGKVDEDTIVWRRPLEGIDKLSKITRHKYTQTLVRSDEPPFKIIKSQGSFFLIRKFDNTFAWIKKTLVKKAKYEELLDFWKKNKLVRDKVIEVDCCEDKVISFWQKYRNVHYFWGGITEEFIDCSGLVQRFFLEVFALVLPKNSKDQQKLGLSIDKGLLQNYDLVFLKHKKTNIRHVGIFYNKQIYHACLDKKGLSIEFLQDLLSRYKFLTAKRIIVCKSKNK